MKFLKITSLIVLLLLVIGAFFIVFTNGKKLSFNPDPIFAYKAFENVKNVQYNKQRTYIIMKDGTKIASTILLPSKTSAPVPVILAYSPYTTSLVVPQMPWYKRMASKYLVGKWGPVYEKMSLKTINTLTSNGYALVFADMRGTGSSTGNSGTMDPMFIQDAEEILEWIAAQPWSNQKIGMIGQSYQGWSQFAAASTQSPYLKCIAPEMIFYNLYVEAVRPGGIYAQKWNVFYSEGTIELNNRNLWNTSFSIPSYPSEPVIDEDGDGILYDEIPIIALNDMDAYNGELSYADGNKRAESPYLALTKEHENNLWPKDNSYKSRFVDDTLMYFGKKVTLANNSVDFLIQKLKETKIPVLLSGGFFDGFSRGIVQSYANLKGTNPVYLFMAPRFHLPAKIAPQYMKFFNYKYAYEDELLSMQMQFFDTYLKGEENGFKEQSPAKIYTAFEGWKQYDNWPPESSSNTNFNLGSNHNLLLSVDKDTSYSYNVDFTHSSSYNVLGTNPQRMTLFNDSIMIRTEHDKKCLVFESEKLIDDIVITGHPIANLYISSNQLNADVYVYLSDVDENGVVHYVTEGKLRAGWHKEFDNDESINNLYEVKLELPWHSYKKINYDNTPFANDSIVNLRFALQPHAWKFQKGHTIRFSIAGADNLNYEFNPAISADNTLEGCKPTVLKVHTGTTYQSYIELPVVK